MGNDDTLLSLPAVQTAQHKQGEAECCGHSLQMPSISWARPAAEGETDNEASVKQLLEHHHIFSPGFSSQIITVLNATAEKLSLTSERAKDYSLTVAYCILSHTPTISYVALWLQRGN